MDHKGYIKKSVDYIETHLCDTMKVADVAKQCHFSAFHFNRLFQKVMGMSVMQYIRERRLSEAAADLAETGESITDIAFKYQFGSEESFSRAFKKRYGESPRYYRTVRRDISCRAVGSRNRAGGTVMCRAA